MGGFEENIYYTGDSSYQRPDTKSPASSSQMPSSAQEYSFLTDGQDTRVTPAGYQEFEEASMSLRQQLYKQNGKLVDQLIRGLDC